MDRWSDRKRIYRFSRCRRRPRRYHRFQNRHAPPGPVEQIYPKYAAQVRIYGELLKTAGILKDRRLRSGLLFTADGSIRWTEQ